MLDSVSLPGGGALASPGVEQPRRRLGRLRKAGAAQPAAGEQGEENAAPNAAAQAAGDSLGPSKEEQPLGGEEPRSQAGDQEQQDEELELEEEDAAEGGSEAAGGEVRPPPCSHNPVCRLCLGWPCLAASQLHALHVVLQEYFDEEDELEEAYARRATQKAVRRAAPAAADASEGGWLAGTPGVL